MTFSRQNCSSWTSAMHLRHPFWSEIKTNQALWGISLMRYDCSCKRKSVLVCCFQTNPLRVIWSPAANYRGFCAASSNSTFRSTHCSPSSSRPVVGSALAAHLASLLHYFQCLRPTAGHCSSVICPSRRCQWAFTWFLKCSGQRFLQDRGVWLMLHHRRDDWKHSPSWGLNDS